ncbi:MAG: DUF2461 domain-containing protein [Pseudomonadota bacterium]
MPDQGTAVTAAGFRLLRELASNNTREWYHAHKAQLNARVRDPFATVLREVTRRLRDSGTPLVGSEKTMFRQFRDTRFSKDKSPMKDNVGGVLTLTGNKNTAGPLVYVHLATSGSFAAAGFYQLGSKELASFRQRIVDESGTVDNLLVHLDGTGLAIEQGEALKRMPRGLEAHADHRHADLLRLKSYIVRRPLAQADWRSGTVVDTVVSLAEQAEPLLRF